MNNYSIDQCFALAAKQYLNSVYGVGIFNKNYRPKNVIFNGPATIVFWNDGSKTVVKCEGEAFDKEKGLAMAIAKKALGNKGNYFEVFKKWTYEEEADE